VPNPVRGLAIHAKRSHKAGQRELASLGSLWEKRDTASDGPLRIGRGIVESVTDVERLGKSEGHKEEQDTPVDGRNVKCPLVGPVSTLTNGEEENPCYKAYPPANVLSKVTARETSHVCAVCEANSEKSHSLMWWTLSSDVRTRDGERETERAESPNHLSTLVHCNSLLRTWPGK
jgi:hypothetical protein